MQPTTTTTDFSSPTLSTSSIWNNILENLSRRSHEVIDFTRTVAFVMIFWLAQSYLLEYSFHQFKHGFFFTMVQFAMYSLFALVQIVFLQTIYPFFNRNFKNQMKEKQLAEDGLLPTTVIDKPTMISKIPLYWYVIIALFSITSTGLSNQSLNAINLPTQIAFKNSKLLFVMLAGIFINNKKYSRNDYIAAALIILGLISLSYSSMQNTASIGTKEASLIAVIIALILVFVALCSDAFYSNFQEKVLKKYNSPNTEFIFYSNAFAALFLIIVCFATNQLFEAVEEIVQEPSILLVMISCSLFGFLGLHMVVHLLKNYGAVITTTVTSVRKCLSILISFVLFPKPLSFYFVLGVVLVFIGVLIDVIIKNVDTTSSKKEKQNSVVC